jgi:formylglycine-generating enzyme required for sulfatase activity
MIKNRTLLLGTLLLAGTLLNTVAEEAAKRKTDPIPMLLVDGGIFMMGKGGLENDEMPAHKVTVSSFFIGPTEVTQAQWKAVVGSDPQDFKGDDFPVTTVNWYEAVGFCNMLSEQAGLRTVYRIDKNVEDPDNQSRYDLQKWTVTCDWSADGFRLPTEAEWEYAARAGTTTAYSFGDDAARLAEFAQFQADQYAKVGRKQPNPWGLFDMHGNVSEWTLDQYEPDAYARLTGNPAKGSWVPSTLPYPHAVRGGNWSDSPERLRSAARLASSADWKMLDPQLPKSQWYHTSAPWIGFRVVRQREIPSAEELYRIWNNGVALDY